VGRSTFYAHFLDKQQLLMSGCAPLQEELERRQRTAVATSRERGLSFSRGMFEHPASYRKVYRALLRTSSSSIVRQQVQELLTGLVRRELDALVTPEAATPLPRVIVLENAVSAFMGLLTWWTEHEAPETATQMDSMYQQLTWPGVLAGLGLLRA
jgi:hypothetical protein